MNTLENLYLHFLTWLGAAPPAEASLPEPILRNKNDRLAFGARKHRSKLENRISQPYTTSIQSGLGCLLPYAEIGFFVIGSYWIGIFRPDFFLMVLILSVSFSLISLATIQVMSEKDKQKRKKLTEAEIFLTRFATRKKLTYFKHKDECWVYGEEQGYEVVYYFEILEQSLSLTCTHLASAPLWQSHYQVLKNNKLLMERPTSQEITDLFIKRLHNPLSKPVKFEGDGRKLYYEEKEFWLSEQNLQDLFQGVIDFAGIYADCYAQVVAAGGQAVVALQEITLHPDHKLQSIAINLLADIAQETEAELKPQANLLRCIYCITPCAAHEVQLGPGIITFYGCRICRQSRDFIAFAGQTVALLDHQTEADLLREDDTLRVNWFMRRGLFDFDEVEIRQASDEEVERFVIQIGNDTDPIRQPRYKRMACVVSSDCDLAENTLRILQRTFGRVERKAYV